MRQALWVIEADATPNDASVHGLLSAESRLDCRKASWEAIAREDWSPREARGVVAVAVPHTATVGAALQRLQQHPLTAPTLAVLPGDASVELVEMASRATDDLLFAPIRHHELRQRLHRMLGAPPIEVDDARERLLQELGMAQLVGNDPVFLHAVAQIPRFARSDMPVFITGETGTGKELCARALHHLGPRRSFPFIAVDCGTIPDHLFENELFGHSRGAYTDAHRDQRGLVAMAEGGTLFLDEVDALSLAAQGKLLRLLQERTFRSLGADRFQRADINVIAASNRDLEACVETRQFRSDLYFRLNVLRLNLPPLRDRVRDIGLLATHFLDGARANIDCCPRSFSATALRALALYRWPGNVRELANVVERAAVTADSPLILPYNLGLPGVVGIGAPPVCFGPARAAALAAFERRYVEEMLQKHRGNVTRAAREARKDRRVFGRLMKKYGIERPT